MTTIPDYILFLWIILIIVYFLGSITCGIIRIKEILGGAEKTEHIDIATLGFIILILLGFSRLFHLLVIIMHGGLYIGEGLSIYNHFLFYISQILFYISVIGILYFFERRTTKFKKIYYTIIVSFIAFFYFIINLIYIFIPDYKQIENISYNLLNYSIGFFGVILCVNFVKISKKTTGTMRNKLLSIFIGTIAFFISYGIAVFEVNILFLFTSISLILGMIAVPLWIYGFKPMALQSLDESQIDESTMTLIEKIGIDFTKPKDLTEEDVNFYREQTVCLVCKSLITGFTCNFICPNCKALYCDKCSKALAKLENSCWSCDGPIDKIKAIKLPEKTKMKNEEKTIIEDIRKINNNVNKEKF